MAPPFARTVTAYVSAASANASASDQRGGSAAAAISRRTMKDRNATANGTSGPTSESAGRRLAAATMPVATSASDTRTSVLPDICVPSLPASGSGPASAQAEDERRDRGRLCRERDHKDDADGRQEVGDRHQSARREDERERQTEGAVRVLPAGVRARGALEEQVTDRDRREQHDLSERDRTGVRPRVVGREQRAREDGVDVGER